MTLINTLPENRIIYFCRLVKSKNFTNYWAPVLYNKLPLSLRNLD